MSDRQKVRDRSKSGVGVSLPRWEDLRFVRGAGRYTDDFRFPDEAHLFIVRSSHAAARITKIDVSAAMAVPGVLGVFTGADADREGMGRINAGLERKRADGSPMSKPPYRVLAMDDVYFVGDAIAAVVADTAIAAQEAADLVVVEYEARPCVVDVVAALQADAPKIWPHLNPDNICYVAREGNAKSVDDAFADAFHVTRIVQRVSRVSSNPMEPRNAIGLHDPVEDRFTLYAGTQSPHLIRTEIAEKILRIPIHKLRVVSPDVGGGFGMKGSHYPEYILVLWLAKKLGRPVRWNATRMESFLSDYHGRDNVWTIDLALDQNGMFTALRAHVIANVGSYLGLKSTLPPANNIGGIAGVYRTPAICSEVVGVYTNTQPMAPYRGAGRPEATYAIEAVIDRAASELGIDRVSLRRRNLIPVDAMPFQTGLVFNYDCGAFEKSMDLALEAGDWDGFSKRREQSERAGKLRGISIINAIELAGGPAGRPGEEFAELHFDPRGNATLAIGSHNHGQGHETSFRQMLTTLLGLDPERVRIVFGDTDVVQHGLGTFGSRSMMAGGTAVKRVSEKIIERGCQVASHLLEANQADIVFEKGTFRVAGTDREVRIEDVARASFQQHALSPGSEMGLTAQTIVAPAGATFPNGSHVCEVEIDPETGKVDVISYVVVDDVGTMINPMLVKGQIHGGIAQGIGQALMESIQYGDDGQILTASFMDYGMPRAADFPEFNVLSNPVPTRTNWFGVKGVGEAGTVGALPAVLAAVVDGLKPFGITHIDMPLTPGRVWQAIQDASARSVANCGYRPPRP